MAGDRRRTEYGDFQTPLELARAIVARLVADGVAPAGVLEPTCGDGAFLVAAREAWPSATLVGLDLAADKLVRARVALGEAATLLARDFFTADWSAILATLPEPLLVLGNPPWVTNAGLGVLESENRPERCAAAGPRGLAALTGQSNFDISEWMIRRLLERLGGRDARLAMICKTAVARRVLEHGWRHGLPIRDAAVTVLDARRHFGVAVDAGLLVCRSGATDSRQAARLFDDLSAPLPQSTFGLRGDRLVADVDAWAEARPFTVAAGPLWRSGIKHDCAPVMELSRRDGAWVNGLDEAVDVEPDHLFPLLKGSDLGGARPPRDDRMVLVPQRTVGADTAHLATSAPATWSYLLRHGARLDARKSRIYRGRARFALFGVGPYAFTPWKVAVSGLHKEPRFRAVGPRADQPVVFDDTCAFLPCRDREEAEDVVRRLASPGARAFFRAFLFRDAKRPITVGLLRRLDLDALGAARCD